MARGEVNVKPTATPVAPLPGDFGLYFHVPYCRALCHYCDFAKTANYGDEHLHNYVDRLVEHTRAWLQLLERQGTLPTFGSVFFGGGTPSLITTGYRPLFELIRPHLRQGAEVSLEANPDDVGRASLSAWRELGINRLSLGVQTFEPAGLDFMRRWHGRAQAERALAQAVEVMPSVNADLIYGWPGQTSESFQADIARARALGVSHLSLYNLTYEQRTPIGRAFYRGRISTPSDDALYLFYAAARDELAGSGFDHQEISNWAKPGHHCRHNHVYWQDGAYLGIGAGAHGYLPRADAPFGWRYHYPRSDRSFLKATAPDESTFGIESEVGRTSEDWLNEYVGSGLRCAGGIDVERAAQITRTSFVPRPLVADAMARGALQRRGARLYLDPSEWFRETAWSLEVILSFRPAKP